MRKICKFLNIAYAADPNLVSFFREALMLHDEGDSFRENLVSRNRSWDQERQPLTIDHVPIDGGMTTNEIRVRVMFL